MPAQDIYKEGTFEETMFDYSNISEKDYWNLSAYHAYTGGDFDLNMIINKMNEEGKKVILVRDSFACTFSTFFSLACSELDIVDYHKQMI